MKTNPQAITQILFEIRDGRASISDVLPVVYDDLRRRARAHLHGRNRSALQTTDLVHEVAGKLLRAAPTDWESRAHFFAIAAKAMRQVLADQAKRRLRLKRGGDWEKIGWDEVLVSQSLLADDARSETHTLDLVALNEALSKLSLLDPRMTRVVECRFLVGMTVKEIAHVLSVSVSTVEADWRAAQAWLRRELREP